jgi:hypothetical protein
MELDHRLRRILEQLLTKTRAGELNWRVDPNNESGFVMGFSVGGVHLVKEVPIADPDRILFKLTNVEGKSAGSWIIEEGDADWQIAQELYNWATLMARGGDQFLDHLERALERSAS